MLIVPLEAVPSQTVQVTLGNQAATINLNTRKPGTSGYVNLPPPTLFIDILVGGAPIVQGVPCEALNLIVRSSYLGFVGDMIFIDNQAASPETAQDPVYTGLGTNGRFSLAWLAPGDLPPDLPVGVS